MKQMSDELLAVSMRNYFKTWKTADNSIITCRKRHFDTQERRLEPAALG